MSLHNTLPPQIRSRRKGHGARRAHRASRHPRSEHVVPRARRTASTSYHVAPRRLPSPTFFAVRHKKVRALGSTVLAQRSGSFGNETAWVSRWRRCRRNPTGSRPHESIARREVAKTRTSENYRYRKFARFATRATNEPGNTRAVVLAAGQRVIGHQAWHRMPAARMPCCPLADPRGSIRDGYAGWIR
jgi:hypothetical protein